MATKELVAYDRIANQLGGMFSVDQMTIPGDITFAGKVHASASIDAPAESALLGTGAISTNYTLTAADFGKGIIEVDTSAGPITITLPADATAAAPIGVMLAVINIGPNVLTLLGEAGTTVNGVALGTAVVTVQYGGAPVYKQAANSWVVVVK